MENKRERIIGLDILKVISIVFVIARHVPLFQYDFIDGQIVNIVQYFGNILFVGVPIFFAVNGFLNLKKDTLDLKKHIFKTIKLFILIILWIFILIFAHMLFDKTPFDKSILVELFLNTDGGSLYTGELWFLQELFAIYLIFPIIHFIYKKEYKLYELLFVVLLIFYVSISSIKLITGLLSNEIRIRRFLQLSNFLLRFTLFADKSSWLFFFMFGGIILKYYEYIKNNRRKFIIVGLIAFTLSLVYATLASYNQKTIYNEFFNDTSIFQIFIILGWFSLFLFADVVIVKKPIILIGANTFGIYVMHSFMIRIGRLLFNEYIFMGRIGILLFSFLTTLIITVLAKKIPYLKELFKI